MMDVRDILRERRRTHGDFRRTASVAQGIKRALRGEGTECETNWASLSPVYREALDMIANKMARIACGDPSEPDHLRDVIGYAQLALEELER